MDKNKLAQPEATLAVNALPELLAVVDAVRNWAKVPYDDSNSDEDELYHALKAYDAVVGNKEATDA